MRCDYPMGYDEDYLEPACEIFLQLFLQNAQIAANEEFNQDNEGVVNDDFENGYESDDFSIFPSPHSFSDGSLSTEEFSADEELIIGTISEASSNAGDLDEEILTIRSPSPDASSSPVDISPVHRYDEIVTIRSPSPDASSTPVDLYDEIISIMSPDESFSPENDSTEEFGNENSDVPSENSHSSRSSLIVNNQNSDTITNVTSQGTDDFAVISTGNLSPPNEIFPEESTVQINTSPSNNISPSLSTFVSLYVVGPPSSFSHESDNLLSEVSSDKLPSDTEPLNSRSPLLIVPDNENIIVEDKSLHTANKICDISEELIPDSSAVCNSFSVKENAKKYLTSEEDSASNHENNVSPEKVVNFDENSHSGFIAFDFHLSEANLHQDKNTSCDITSDKSMQNLKRKVTSSVDDDVLNKVPKYSISHESNNEVSLDNYSKELSNDSEKPILCDEDKIDNVPSTVNVENVILPLGKTVDENSITEQQTDL